MPLSRLSPDYHERLGQQIDTGGSTDPWLPPVTTTTVPTYDPYTALSQQGQSAPAGGSDPNRPSYRLDPVTGQTVLVGGTPGGSRPTYKTTGYQSPSDVPMVRLEDFADKGVKGRGGIAGAWDKFMGSGGINNISGKYSPAAIDKYAKAKINRIGSLQKLAGVPLDERRLMREQIKVGLAQLDPKMSPVEKAAAVDQLIASKVDEASLSDQAVATSISGVPQTGTDPSMVQYTPEQIARLQAAAAQYMKPYTDKLNTMGMSDIAAAYMNQARVAPLIAAAQERDQLARQNQTLQNQLLSYQQGAAGGGADVNAIVQQLTG